MKALKRSQTSLYGPSVTNKSRKSHVISPHNEPTEPIFPAKKQPVVSHTHFQRDYIHVLKR